MTHLETTHSESLEQLSLPKRAQTLESELFEVSFLAAEDRVESFRIDVYDKKTYHIGSIEFESMSLIQGQQVLAELFGLGSDQSSQVDPLDPLPELQNLRNALRIAESADIGFSSELGNNAIDITATTSDSVSENLTQRTLRSYMQAEEVLPGLIHIHFPSQYLACSTMLRAQEHYESPRFRGRTFDLEEYQKWYRGTQEHGAFSYYEDWGGFNVPDYVFSKLAAGDFGELSKKEKALLTITNRLKSPFYVIATYGTDNVDTHRHEVAHGLFYLNALYRAEVLKALVEFDTSDVADYIRDLGYHDSSVKDETHAYVMESLKDLRQDCEDTLDRKVDLRHLRKLHNRLNKIFERYAGGVA